VVKPDYVAAYENRARAFVDKGDYTRAVDDVNKAGELRSKITVQSKAVLSATEPAPCQAAAKSHLEHDHQEILPCWVGG
jgi:hypothetical protein